MSDDAVTTDVPDIVRQTAIHKSYLRSPYLSVKHSSYFLVYEELLARYRDTDVTFVEVGVLNGGSLFMWRDYFGPKARIIGVDLNPLARRWQDEGFEIHIGSQSDPAFWADFFAKVGPVDVLLDDGGHTNEQQVVTSECAIPHIRDGGLLIVEDTHTSYFREFGNPSSRSFIAWAQRVADAVNSRFPAVHASAMEHRRAVFHVAFYESIVSFHVDRQRCFDCRPTSNAGRSLDAKDFRLDDARAAGAVDALTERLRRHEALRRMPLMRWIHRKLTAALSWQRAQRGNARIGRYFR
jgi:hypothetical protein